MYLQDCKYKEMEEAALGKVIGIDLGTTNSCVAVLENDQPVVITNAEGSRTTPSVVAFTKNGERLVGDTAKRQAAVNVDRTFFSIKREMGTNYRAKIDGKQYTPQEISSMILRKLKKDAEEYLGETVSDAVITVPAYFNDAQRQATKDAGRIAGLNVLRIINEPTSAALAYGLDHGQPQKILVYDLGGGTFDVSVIEIGDNLIEVLSSSSTTSINLPFITTVKGEPKHMEMTLTRAKFDELTRDLVERTRGPVQQALSDAGITAADLGMVLLVGGSTRMPSVYEEVTRITGREPSRNLNPDECVALGAAVQGGKLGGTLVAGSSAAEIILMDVTPLSLSIETMGGISTKLIDRNTTIPTRYSKVFTTASNFQTSVDIKVLQGERQFAKDNKLLGRFQLRGIKPAPAGVPQIEVTFDIDANGIVQVSAKDLGTGRHQEITITASSNLSDAEIERAIREAAEYEATDGQRKAYIDSRSEADTLIRQVENAYKEKKKGMDGAKKRQIKSSLSYLKKLVSHTKPGNVTEEQSAEIRRATAELRTAAAEIL